MKSKSYTSTAHPCILVFPFFLVLVWSSINRYFFSQKKHLEFSVKFTCRGRLKSRGAAVGSCEPWWRAWCWSRYCEWRSYWRWKVCMIIMWVSPLKKHFDEYDFRNIFDQFVFYLQTGILAHFPLFRSF